MVKTGTLLSRQIPATGRDNFLRVDKLMVYTGVIFYVMETRALIRKVQERDKAPGIAAPVKIKGRRSRS